jgi:hypothetical protein
VVAYGRAVTTATRSDRLRNAIAYAATDDGATWAFRVVLLLSVVALVLVGRHQWFVRDDWALIVTRGAVRDSLGWKDWLFAPQDGHWMTVPVLTYRALQNTVGLGSYVPFLALVMILHVAIVLVVRVLCRRCGASPWTTTLVCALLLLFGTGWENIVFAVQITFNLSLLAFVVQLALIDHEGPVDRRDVLGSAIAMVGVMSSAFGPIFIAGIVVLLALRKRWLALVVAVVPQGVAYVWWYLFWQSGSTTHVPSGSTSLVPAFVAQGLGSSLHSLVVLPGLAGIGLLATIGIALWKGNGWRTQSLLLTVWATALVMLFGIGVERVGFGVAYATTSRYQYMTVMLLAPAFALAVDQLKKVTVVALWVGRLVVAFAAVVNLGWLMNEGDKFATASQHQRDTFELITGSGLADQADQNHVPEPFSSDISVHWLPWLVHEQAITPRTPANQAEVDRVRAALGLPPATP